MYAHTYTHAHYKQSTDLQNLENICFALSVLSHCDNTWAAGV